MYDAIKMGKLINEADVWVNVVTFSPLGERTAHSVNKTMINELFAFRNNQSYQRMMSDLTAVKEQENPVQGMPPI